MKLKAVVLLLSHLGVGLVGFALGIYALPILTATPSASSESLANVASQSRYQAEFVKDLKDSDGLHWGQATVYVSPNAIAWQGELAPGPAYRLYLSKDFIETEAEFLRQKPNLLKVGEVTSFGDYLLELPQGVNVDDYSSVIIWCESFNEFITAAQYRELQS